MRESAKELEIELESGTGEVNQNMGNARVSVDLDGETRILFARRISPVSAVVTQINNLNEKQYYGTTVVFDAAPLNSLDHEDEEGYRCDEEGYYTYLYKGVVVLPAKEHFYFAIDGVYPGDENWDKLVDKLIALDIGVSVRSNADYILIDSNDKY